MSMAYGPETARMRAGAIYLYEMERDNLKVAIHHLEAAQAAHQACNTPEHNILSEGFLDELRKAVTMADRRIEGLKNGLDEDIKNCAGDDE